MHTITLDTPVPAEHQPEVLRNLCWLDARIETPTFDADDGRLLRFEFPVTEAVELDGRVRAAINRLAAACRAAPAKTVYVSHRPPPAQPKSTYRLLVDRGWIMRGCAGTHIYSGAMSELYHALDAEFRRQALALGVEECKFPTLIDVHVLARAGYFDNFAHHANLVCHLPEHADAVRQFRDDVAGGDTANAAWKSGAPLACDCAAGPTVCYHFYRLNESRVIELPVRGATAVSPCYRFEGNATGDLHRLREFNMREIMFVGEAEAVADRRAVLLDCMKSMLEQCGLAARLRTASDPFFVDDADRKRLFQMSFDLKHEAQAYLPGRDEWLAIGSVNLHLDHFGRAFSISTADGGAAHSCCLGFGLDRWCLAIFDQHGLDETAWPEELRDWLGRHRADRSAAPATEATT